MCKFKVGGRVTYAVPNVQVGGIEVNKEYVVKAVEKSEFGDEYF